MWVSSGDPLPLPTHIPVDETSDIREIASRASLLDAMSSPLTPSQPSQFVLLARVKSLWLCLSRRRVYTPHTVGIQTREMWGKRPEILIT